MTSHTTEDWERELNIGKDDLRKTLNVEKLRAVIRNLAAKKKEEGREEILELARTELTYCEGESSKNGVGLRALLVKTRNLPT